MKSYIKKIANSDIGIKIRNTLSFRKVSHSFPTSLNQTITVSDCFLWRTDNGYKTIFKFTDFLNLFYKINDSWVEIHFYSKDNRFIKNVKIENLDLSNEFHVSSEFLNNIEDYGLFYIFHHVEKKDKSEKNLSVNNRCYVGYSQNDNLYSFVHGNVWAKSKSIYPSNFSTTDMVKTSLIKNFHYTIQKYFKDYDKNELFFANPTTKKIKFSVEGKNFSLRPNCVNLINIKGPIITINSNCALLRPTVFSYKDNFVDAHHA